MSTGLSRATAYRTVAGFAKTELLSGVTTIRTVGGLGTFDTRLRDGIAAGKKIGPRILAANEGISVPGGHMAGSVAIAAENIDAAVAHVEEAKRENVDLIKLMITGGVLVIAMISVPPPDAPILNKMAALSAGRKIAKISSNTGSVVSGALIGNNFSSADNQVIFQREAATILRAVPEFPPIRCRRWKLC